MTMQLEVSVTGSQVGRLLAGDEEECWYALAELADSGSAEFATEVAGYAYGEEMTKVAAFLRQMADALDPPKEG